jgi:UDP-2,3-diacylglucosamine pyrophosphatase LpxH
MSSIVPRGEGPVIDRKILLFSDVHSMDGSDNDASMRSYVKLCNLTDWAMDNEYWIASVGDFADVAAGFTPEQIIKPRREQIRKLNTYRIERENGAVWLHGNHDHGIIDKRAYDWDGIPEVVYGKTLIHHGHKYYWANYGRWCWLVGKPIIYAGQKLGHRPEQGRVGDRISRIFFSNRKMIARGKAELKKRGLRLLICGHTHKSGLHHDARHQLTVLNLGDMVEHGTFGIVTPEEILLCV